jgi:hypothetical protein
MILEEASVAVTHRVFGKMCIVAVQLKNGFVLIGQASCVDPNNYNEVLGYEYAMRDIEDQLWKLEGYALQKSLAGEL